MTPHYSKEHQPQIHLAFVTDGHPAQFLGIAHIINSLNINSGEKTFNYPIWLVLPETTKLQVNNWLRCGCGDLDFRFVNADTRVDDKYYIQLSLTKVIRLLGKHDALISLDYDHLVLEPTAFPFEIPYSGILVSSEVSDDVMSQLSPEAKELSGEIRLPKIHLNASLIYGIARDLRKISRLWIKSYKELSPYVTIRHRVELALSMASELANTDVKPCHSKIQSNFAIPSSDCCLFHYGGESIYASIIKGKLLEVAENIVNNSINPEVVRQAGVTLINELLRFI
jgi:hypothetical protein